MNVINDGFGDQPSVPEVEDFIATMTGWLGYAARSLVGANDPRLADLMQEGRIAMWRDWDELSAEDEATRSRYAMHRAKRRMMQILRGEAVTGHAPMPGRPEVKPVVSLDQPVGEDGTTLADLIGEVVSIEGVEIAYHHGEIQQAIEALTPRQQRYVYARFWCGMDPSDGLHSNPGMKAARDNNPDLRRDILWTGSKTSAGAKRRLVEALGHLAGVAR